MASENRNNGLTEFGDANKYVNSDESMLSDANRPRDQFGFRINREGNNLETREREKKFPFFKCERYINISGSQTSYQDIQFKPGDTQTVDEIGLKKEQYGDIAEINSDGFIYMKHGGLYQVSVIAQFLKDGEWTSANLYSGPVGWYIRREEERDKRVDSPHIMLSSSSISFILDLRAKDVLVPKAGGTVNGTIWFSIVQLG